MPQRKLAQSVIGRNSIRRCRHGWPICEFGWHALTIGKGVGIANNSEIHALPDGQGRATHDSKLNSNRTSSQPWPPDQGKLVCESGWHVPESSKGVELD